MVQSMLGDRRDDWSVGTLDLVLALLREALRTGEDDGVGERLRAAAVAVRNDTQMARALALVRHGDKLTNWESFLLGAVTGVVDQALHETPEMTRRVLIRWYEQQRTAGKEEDGA